MQSCALCSRIVGKEYELQQHGEERRKGLTSILICKRTTKDCNAGELASHSSTCIDAGE